MCKAQQVLSLLNTLLSNQDIEEGTDYCCADIKAFGCQVGGCHIAATLGRRNSGGALATEFDPLADLDGCGPSGFILRIFDRGRNFRIGQNARLDHGTFHGTQFIGSGRQFRIGCQREINRHRQGQGTGWFLGERRCKRRCRQRVLHLCREVGAGKHRESEQGSEQQRGR